MNYSHFIEREKSKDKTLLSRRPHGASWKMLGVRTDTHSGGVEKGATLTGTYNVDVGEIYHRSFSTVQYLKPLFTWQRKRENSLAP